MGVPEVAPRREKVLGAFEGSGQRELIAAAQAGDPAARRQVVESNLRLVHSIVRRFSFRLHAAGAGADAEDLFQVGCLGLLKAVDGFDVSRPVRFPLMRCPSS